MLLQSANRDVIGKTLLSYTAVSDKHGVKMLGCFGGVFVPTCEAMWGCLIFLRFFYVVSQAGLGLALLMLLVAVTMAMLTISSVSAICTSGGQSSRSCFSTPSDGLPSGHA